MISTGGDDEKERKEECNFQIIFKNVQKVQKDKKDLLKNAGVFPSHVSARDSKYHHGRNQFAAAVDSLKGLNSIIGEMF